MNDFLRRPDCANKKITQITFALLNELHEKPETLETALDLWLKIKDANSKRIEPCDRYGENSRGANTKTATTTTRCCFHPT